MRHSSLIATTAAAVFAGGFDFVGVDYARGYAPPSKRKPQPKGPTSKRKLIKLRRKQRHKR